MYVQCTNPKMGFNIRVVQSKLGTTFRTTAEENRNYISILETLIGKILYLQSHLVNVSSFINIILY